MKKITLYTLSSVLLTAFALLSVSCGAVGKVREAAARQQKVNDFKQLGLAYHNYCDTNNKKGPAKADDLAPLMEGGGTVLPKVKSGEYTIIWGVNVSDREKFAPAGMSGTVLGYETNPTGGSRVVLLADGAARIMSETEFSGMPKAKSAPGK